MKLFNRESRAEKLAKKGALFFKRADGEAEEKPEGEPTAEMNAAEEEAAPEETVIPPRTIEELTEAVLQLSTKKGAYPAASDGEKAFARELRDLANGIDGVKVRLEPYYIRPLLGRRSLILLAGVLLLSLILYFGYTPVALAALLCAAPITLLLSLGRQEIAFLLPKRIAYNAVAVADAEQTDKTILITSSYDSVYGSPYRMTRLAKVEKPLLAVAAAAAPAVLLLLCILKIALGFDTVPKMVAFSLTPILIVLPSVFYLATYTSWDKRHIVENNQKASGAALATFEYFAARPEERPANTRLIFAAFSGRQNGNSGAAAFVKQHWGRDDLLINPAVIDVEAITGGDFTVPEYDAAAFKASGADAAAKLKAALDAANIAYVSTGKKLASGSDHTFSAFTAKQIEAATLAVRENTTDAIDFNESETITSVIKVLIETVKRL